MNPDKFSEIVSSDIPDWSREDIERFWDPGRKLLRSIRQYQRCKSRKGTLWRVIQKYWVIVHWFWSLVTQSEIHLNCNIGGGLRLPHPTGIIVHPDSNIGVNCQLFHHVTLAGKVTLGGHVDVGAGAQLMGPVTIGDDVQIGFNSVVLNNVEDGCIVAGIPAKVITTKASD